MLFTRYNSIKQVNVNINKYLIDWNDSPSKEQQILQDFLHFYWKNRVVLAEFRIPGSLFRIDILNLSNKIAIEYSPDSTHDFNPFFHTYNSFKERVKNDINKIKYLEDEGFKVIEVKKPDLKHLSRRFFLDNFDIIL